MHDNEGVIPSDNYALPLFYMISNLLKDTLLFVCCSLIPLPCLFDVFGDIFLLQLPHALNFVQIDNEAGVVAVMQTDALAAEYSQVVAAVEVLHSLWVLLAQFLLERVLVLVSASSTSLFKIEIRLGQNRVLFDDFVQNVDVEWESLC